VPTEVCCSACKSCFRFVFDWHQQVYIALEKTFRGNYFKVFAKNKKETVNNADEHLRMHCGCAKKSCGIYVRFLKVRLRSGQHNKRA